MERIVFLSRQPPHNVGRFSHLQQQDLLALWKVWDIFIFFLPNDKSILGEKTVLEYQFAAFNVFFFS